MKNILSKKNNKLENRKVIAKEHISDLGERANVPSSKDTKLTTGKNHLYYLNTWTCYGQSVTFKHILLISKVKMRKLPGIKNEERTYGHSNE